MEKIDKEFLKASWQTGVPVKKIEDIFWYLLKTTKIDNNELVKKVGISKNALNKVKKTLADYLIPSSNQTALKQEKKAVIKKHYGRSYFPEENLLFKAEKTDAYQRTLKLLSSLKTKRPRAAREFDQFIATAETVVKRAVLINFLGDLKNRRLLFLGDDDFTSLAAASINLADKITVVDLDQRILDSLKKIAQKNNFGIETVKHDLKLSLPKSFQNNFDTVFTDPPYTPAGIKLFASRAVEALDRKNPAARIYLCWGNSDRAKERFLPIQQVLTELGLMIRYVFDKFNRYEGAQSVGNASTLYVTETTPKLKPLIHGIYEKPIYTYD